MDTMIDQYGEVIIAITTLLTAMMGVLSGWLVWQQYKQKGRNAKRDKELEEVKSTAERDRLDHSREMEQLKNMMLVQERFFEVIAADRQESSERDRRHTASYDLLRQAVEKSVSVDVDVKDSLVEFRAELSTLRDETQESRKQQLLAEEEYKLLREKIGEYIRSVESALKGIQDDIGAELIKQSQSQHSKLNDVLREMLEIRKVIESSMRGIKEQREKTKPIPEIEIADEQSSDNSIIKPTIEKEDTHEPETN